jgi:rhodanese-related sulfurtransferase
MNSTSSSACISPQELSVALAAGGCQLIDVREPVEHAEAHVNGAKLISLGQIEARCSEIDRQRPVIVMCQAGRRGQRAADKLRKLGFNDVRNLEGGMLAWKAAGMACVEGSRKVIPLMRQVQIVVGVCVFVGSLLAVLVDPKWVCLPMFFGAGLIFAGTTGFCGLALLLAKLPWNRADSKPCGKPSCEA